LRWLQEVTTSEGTWDGFEAISGVPFTKMVAGGKRIPWSTLRHWLHDLASELWAGGGDRSLPDRLSLDHVWISSSGSAMLLDEPWPDLPAPAAPIPVHDIAGQQRFLDAVAATVEPTGLPLHARPMLQNLKEGRFEKISYFTGTLRGILDRPAEVGPGIRAGAMYMLPFYTWIMIFVGAHRGADWLYEIIRGSGPWVALAAAGFVLVIAALVQLVLVPFRTTSSYALFRLAVIDDTGEPAGPSTLLSRWAITWLPLLVPLALAILFVDSRSGVTLATAVVYLLAWGSLSAFALLRPNRGLQDRLAGTWVVRQ
jgi:hypothetical protein